MLIKNENPHICDTGVKGLRHIDNIFTQVSDVHGPELPESNETTCKYIGSFL